MSKSNNTVRSLYKEFRENEELKEVLEVEFNTTQEKLVLFGIGDDTMQEHEHISHVNEELEALKLKINTNEDETTRILNELYILANQIIQNGMVEENYVIVTYKGASYRIIVDESGDNIDAMRIIRN